MYKLRVHIDDGLILKIETPSLDQLIRIQTIGATVHDVNGSTFYPIHRINKIQFSYVPVQERRL